MCAEPLAVPPWRAVLTFRVSLFFLLLSNTSHLRNNTCRRVVSLAVMTLCASLRLVIIVVLVVLPRSTFPFVSQIIMPLPLCRRLKFYVPSYVSSYVPSYVPSYGPFVTLFVPSSIKSSSTMALYSSSSSPSPSSPPPPPPSPSSTLTVATYNILSTSLASPASPWLLTLPECLDPTGEVKKAIEREYFQGWHKNKEAGNWKRFRKLFGSQGTNVQTNEQTS